MRPTPPPLLRLAYPAPAGFFAPGADLWLRAGRMLRCLWLAPITLLERGPAASVDPLPPEYFRFPPF